MLLAHRATTSLRRLRASSSLPYASYAPSSRRRGAAPVSTPRCRRTPGTPSARACCESRTTRRPGHRPGACRQASSTGRSGCRCRSSSRPPCPGRGASREPARGRSGSDRRRSRAADHGWSALPPAECTYLGTDVKGPRRLERLHNVSTTGVDFGGSEGTHADSPAPGKLPAVRGLAGKRVRRKVGAVVRPRRSVAALVAALVPQLGAIWPRRPRLCCRAK